jgi:hypothetical protein
LIDSGAYTPFNAPVANNNGQPFLRPSNPMGMSNNGFGMNPMQQNQPYGGMKRPSQPLNDGSDVSKRARPDTESWGAMGGDGRNNNPTYGYQQQTNTGAPWYQDQSYASSQQQSSYSWN